MIVHLIRSRHRIAALKAGNFEVDHRSDFAKGLVGFWPLGVHPAGSDFDYSIYRNHGTRQGGLTRTISNHTRFGSIHVPSFDAVDDYIRVPTNPIFDINALDSFSVSLWLRTTAEAPVSLAYLMCKYRQNGPSHFVLRLNTSEQANFAIFDGSTSTNVTGTSILKDGVWHHVVGIRDTVADTLHIYVDGKEENSITDATTGSLANTTNLYFGALLDVPETSPLSTTMFNGSLSFASFTRRALGPAEVRDQYLRPELLIRPRGATVTFLPAAAGGPQTIVIPTAIARAKASPPTSSGTGTATIQATTAVARATAAAPTVTGTDEAIISMPIATARATASPPDIVIGAAPQTIVMPVAVARATASPLTVSGVSPATAQKTGIFMKSIFH